MKTLRYLTLLLSIVVIMMLQACGDGNTNTDTTGALIISQPTLTDNKDGSFSVAVSVTYEPPPGKTAQGIEVTTIATDAFGNFQADTHTYTSGSNSVIYSFFVLQRVGSSTSLSISSNIGDMRSSVSAVIPAITPMGAPAVQFLSTDAPGTVLTSAITGGVIPYSFVSVSTPEIFVTLVGTTLNVTNTTTGVNTASATITVSDARGSLLSVPVRYFK